MTERLAKDLINSLKKNVTLLYVDLNEITAISDSVRSSLKSHLRANVALAPAVKKIGLGLLESFLSVSLPKMMDLIKDNPIEIHQVLLFQ